METFSLPRHGFATDGSPSASLRDVQQCAQACFRTLPPRSCFPTRLNRYWLAVSFFFWTLPEFVSLSRTTGKSQEMPRERYKAKRRSSPAMEYGNGNLYRDRDWNQDRDWDLDPRALRGSWVSRVLAKKSAKNISPDDDLLFGLLEQGEGTENCWLVKGLRTRRAAIGDRFHAWIYAVDF